MQSVLSKIGPVMQVAYVPQDFYAAITYWTGVMGVGPFFQIPNAGLENVRYYGESTDMEFSLALAYWGDIQIELIQPVNDSPSMYVDWLAQGKEGVQHMCVLTADFEGAMAICTEHNLTTIHDADVPGGGKVAYVDTGGGDGTVLEILQPAPGSDEFFEMIKETCANWDGSEPIRKLG